MMGSGKNSESKVPEYNAWQIAKPSGQTDTFKVTPLLPFTIPLPGEDSFSDKTLEFYDHTKEEWIQSEKYPCDIRGPVVDMGLPSSEGYTNFTLLDMALPSDETKRLFRTKNENAIELLRSYAAHPQIFLNIKSAGVHADISKGAKPSNSEYELLLPDPDGPATPFDIAMSRNFGLHYNDILFPQLKNKHTEEFYKDDHAILAGIFQSPGDWQEIGSNVGKSPVSPVLSRSRIGCLKDDAPYVLSILSRAFDLDDKSRKPEDQAASLKETFEYLAFSKFLSKNDAIAAKTTDDQMGEKKPDDYRKISFFDVNTLKKIEADDPSIKDIDPDQALEFKDKKTGKFSLGPVTYKASDALGNLAIVYDSSSQKDEDVIDLFRRSIKTAKRHYDASPMEKSLMEKIRDQDRDQQISEFEERMKSARPHVVTFLENAEFGNFDESLSSAYDDEGRVLTAQARADQARGAVQSAEAPLTKLGEKTIRATMETAVGAVALSLAKDGIMYLAREFISAKNLPPQEAATPTVTAPESPTLRTGLAVTAILSAALAAGVATRAYKSRSQQDVRQDVQQGNRGGRSQR